MDKELHAEMRGAFLVYGRVYALTHIASVVTMIKIF